MKRSYYSNSIINFIKEDNSSILGTLNSEYNLENRNRKQNNSWESQIDILKTNLSNLNQGHIFFEFSIPRMGKRADNILIIADLILVLEFKVGSNKYDAASIDQVMDYSLDLRNFHEGSHTAKLVPILISTNGDSISPKIEFEKEICKPILSNKSNLNIVISNVASTRGDQTIDPLKWESSKYKPTPTIIEAAQALYRGHQVKDITRYEGDCQGENNLLITADHINRIIDKSKNLNEKSICFITGVPGAGKTLVGLNIVNERKKISEDENAVFLSGNGPLVQVLREALARDRKKIALLNNQKLKIDDARREVNSSIQNIHHFRDEYFRGNEEPNEKVVVFDEAQRAWNQNKTSAFVKEKYKKQGFQMSEPECLIDFMNRRKEWCSIICLIGGGQEINTGEAGIEEWLNALRNKFTNWKIYFSDSVIGSNNYIKSSNLIQWVEKNGNAESELHLSVPVRSFRAEKLSELIESILSLNSKKAKYLYKEICNDYPIVITRSLPKSKIWLKKMKQGSERIGILISSSSKRIRPNGVDAENGLRSNSGKAKIANWFLNPENDIRSSSFLEIPATQFAVQGLELDWICLAWGGDLSLNNNNWSCRNFTGTSWKNIGVQSKKEFLINTYRVLLTRARQGMVIYIPKGHNEDVTRKAQYYDGTFEYLKTIGIKELI